MRQISSRSLIPLLHPLFPFPQHSRRITPKPPTVTRSSRCFRFLVIATHIEYLILHHAFHQAPARGRYCRRRSRRPSLQSNSFHLNTRLCHRRPDSDSEMGWWRSLGEHPAPKSIFPPNQQTTNECNQQPVTINLRRGSSEDLRTVRLITGEYPPIVYLPFYSIQLTPCFRFSNRPVLHLDRP